MASGFCTLGADQAAGPGREVVFASPRPPPRMAWGDARAVVVAAQDVSAARAANEGLEYGYGPPAGRRRASSTRPMATERAHGPPRRMLRRYPPPQQCATRRPASNPAAAAPARATRSCRRARLRARRHLQGRVVRRYPRSTRRSPLPAVPPAGRPGADHPYPPLNPQQGGQGAALPALSGSSKRRRRSSTAWGSPHSGPTEARPTFSLDGPRLLSGSTVLD